MLAECYSEQRIISILHRLL